MGLGAAVLFVLALNSHAAAGSTATAVAFDWLHFIAVAAWVGGLLHLVASVWTLLQSPHPPEGTTVAAPLVPPFPALGVLRVGSLMLTGFYQSWLNVGRLCA